MFGCEMEGCERAFVAFRWGILAKFGVIVKKPVFLYHEN